MGLIPRQPRVKDTPHARLGNGLGYKSPSQFQPLKPSSNFGSSLVLRIGHGAWEPEKPRDARCYLIILTYYLDTSSHFPMPKKKGERVGHKPGSVLEMHKYTFYISRAVIYLGRLLPNASSGSHKAELEKDQP